MNEVEQNLTDKQFLAISIILGAKSITEGVEKARISKTTFYEWLKNPKFKAEFIRQRKEIVELALHELKASIGEAVRVLRELLDSENDNIRLKVSTAILDHFTKFKEFEELEEQIEKVERVFITKFGDE